MMWGERLLSLNPEGGVFKLSRSFDEEGSENLLILCQNEMYNREARPGRGGGTDGENSQTYGILT